VKFDQIMSLVLIY